MDKLWSVSKKHVLAPKLLSPCYKRIGSRVLAVRISSYGTKSAERRLKFALFVILLLVPTNLL